MGSFSPALGAHSQRIMSTLLWGESALRPSLDAKRLRGQDDLYGLQIMEGEALRRERKRASKNQGFPLASRMPRSASLGCLHEHPAVTALFREPLEATYYVTCSQYD